MLVPSKTLKGFHGYAPRQSSGKAKDEVKVLAHQTAGHTHSLEDFEKFDTIVLLETQAVDAYLDSHYR